MLENPPYPSGSSCHNHRDVDHRSPLQQLSRACEQQQQQKSSAVSSRDAQIPTQQHKPKPEPISSALSSRSPWLVLPSVSAALNLYGDAPRSTPRFSLVVRQQPRTGLAIGNSQMSLRTARSVPLDPPPVCELLIDRRGEEQLLALPEVFVRAQLVTAETPDEECLSDARRNEPLVGDTLQSPFNSRIDTREDQSFFIFKELGVRNRGQYRIRFDLFDRVGVQISRVASVYTDAFEVLERRKHPGLSASTGLMDALVDRGMKYKLRKATDKQSAKKRKSPDHYFYNDERLATARRQSYAGDYDQTAYLAERRFEHAYSLPQQQHARIPPYALPSRSPPQYTLPDPRRTAFDLRRDPREMLPPLDSLGRRVAEWSAATRYVHPLPRRSSSHALDAWSREAASPPAARPTLPSWSQLKDSRDRDDARDDKRSRMFYPQPSEPAAPVSPGRGLGLNHPSDQIFSLSGHRQSAFEDVVRPSLDVLPRLEVRSSSSSTPASRGNSANTISTISDATSCQPQTRSPSTSVNEDKPSPPSAAPMQKYTLPPISSLYSPPSPSHITSAVRAISTSPPGPHREW